MHTKMIGGEKVARHGWLVPSKESFRQSALADSRQTNLDISVVRAYVIIS